MRVTIVGSGTLIPDDLHRSPGHLVETERHAILLDCGSGVVHGLARDGRDWARISHVAITHFHTDHFGDLPALLWAWKHGVPKEEQLPRVVIGPKGMRAVLEDLSHAYGPHVLEPGGALEVVELGPHDVWEEPGGGFVLKTHDTIHTETSVAYRLEVAEVVLGYTGDTGAHPPLAEFMSGTDVLIAECSVPDNARQGNHLCPEEVGTLAARAGSGVLVLTHLYSGVERVGLEDRIRAVGFAGGIRVADDGLTLEV